MLQKKKEGKGHKDVMDLSFRVQIQTKKEARNAENTEITKNKNKTKEYSCSVWSASECLCVRLCGL